MCSELNFSLLFRLSRGGQMGALQMCSRRMKIQTKSEPTRGGADQADTRLPPANELEFLPLD